MKKEVKLQKSNINRDVSHIEKKVISGMEFMSIQDELFREYKIPSEFGVQTVRIDEPQWLFVRPSKTHMVEDKNGAMHYIPYFVHLVWENKPKAVRANF